MVTKHQDFANKTEIYIKLIPHLKSAVQLFMLICFSLKRSTV